MTLYCITVHLQFLSDTIEAVFRRFKYSDLVNAEYKIRATIQHSTNTVPRSHSTFCVFLQFKGENGAEYSGIEIEHYDHTMCRFEKSTQIRLEQRMDFQDVMQKNKIFVLGGVNNNDNTYLKSVSLMVNHKGNCNESIFSSLML